MSEKVILILVDGMRPDGMTGCGNPFVRELLDASTYSLDARTVFPSVTLPCHMSLFSGVDTDRHGILTNTYVPQVRPVDSIVDVLDRYGKKNAFFYTWEELRDLYRTNHVHTALFLNEHKYDDAYGYTEADNRITDAAIRYINDENPDFLFLYLGDTDLVGHHSGWMTEEYLECVGSAISCVKRVKESIPDGYTIILTADHGGHERSHGSQMDEDMTIPICLCGPSFEKGKEIHGVSIKDIAVTVADMLEVPPAAEWEGRSLKQ